MTPVSQTSRIVENYATALNTLREEQSSLTLGCKQLVRQIQDNGTSYDLTKEGVIDLEPFIRITSVAELIHGFRDVWVSLT